MEPVSLDGAILKGDPKANVAVVEYSEFQCPFCGRFARDTMPSLAARYIDSGKVLWAFRHFPLEQIHVDALRAGMAGECAARQGKFWELHALLFRNQKALDSASLTGHVRSVGIDGGRFEACMTESAEAKVKTDLRGGRALGVTGTPTFFIGRIQPDGRVKVLERISGAVPIDRFQQALDPLLVQARAATRR